MWSVLHRWTSSCKFLYPYLSHVITPKSTPCRTLTKNMSRRKIIVDADPGVDDAQAIMMALTSDVDLMAVTCVAGNTNLDQVAINTLRVLEACSCLNIENNIVGLRHWRLQTRVPVYRGCCRSLLGEHEDSTDHHGSDGLGGKPADKPPSLDLVQPGHASQVMVDIVNKYPGEVTLVGLAPLTNIALAVHLDPAFGRKLQGAVIMGGNIRGVGNTTASAEFNFGHDPEAAHVVLQDLGCPIRLVAYEVCTDTQFDWAWFDQLMEMDTAKGQFHRSINEYTRKRRKEVLKMAKYISCDPVAMAVAIDDTVALETESQFCTVELQGKVTRGQMVVDWNNVSSNAPNVEIVTKVDIPKIQVLYEQMLK